MAAPDWKSLYPFRSHLFHLDGLQYHYLDEGSGEPLLLVHGNPTWSFYWRQVVERFRTSHRCLAVDHIGCGLSSKPQAYGYRLQQHVDNLVRLIEHLDLRGITLVAHDWGGAIGMGAAVRLPARFARLVLMNTAAFRAARVPWRIRMCRAPLLGTLAVRGLNGFLLAALRQATAKPERFRGAIRAGYLAPFGSFGQRVAIHGFVRDIPLSPRHASYQTLLDIETGLSQFKNHPVLLIWGMRDWCFTPWFLERFIEFFPAADVRRIEDAGHWVVEDAGPQVNHEIASFLLRHPIVSPAAVEQKI
jgi:haloalkane dehalogenase